MGTAQRSRALASSDHILMYDHTECSDWIGRVGDYQLRHKPQLDTRYCSAQLHNQRLYRIAERNLDWNRDRHIVCREWAFGFDGVQLHS